MGKKERIKPEVLKTSDTTKPDYDRLRQMGYQYVVEQGKTQKEAAAILGVAENTMSEWAIEENWRGLRKARQSSANTARDNIQSLISLLSDKRLNLEYKINEAKDAGDTDSEIRLRKEAAQVSNEMAYHNRALIELNKEKGITLGQYVDTFDDIFSSLRTYSPDLFEQTIEFQTMHLRRKSNELG